MEAISQPTIACILKKYQVSLKQIYVVAFERNAERVKQRWTEYVKVCTVSRFLLRKIHVCPTLFDRVIL